MVPVPPQNSSQVYTPMISGYTGSSSSSLSSSSENIRCASQAVKPNSITLAGSELVRSWFKAGSKPNSITLSDSNQLPTSSERASVMEFGFYKTSGQIDLTNRLHRRRIWPVQSYSPCCANMQHHLYMVPWAHTSPCTSQTTSRSVQRFLQGSRS